MFSNVLLTLLESDPLGAALEVWSGLEIKNEMPCFTEGIGNLYIDITS